MPLWAPPVLKLRLEQKSSHKFLFWSFTHPFRAWLQYRCWGAAAYFLVSPKNCPLVACWWFFIFLSNICQQNLSFSLFSAFFCCCLHNSSQCLRKDTKYSSRKMHMSAVDSPLSPSQRGGISAAVLGAWAPGLLCLNPPPPFLLSYHCSLLAEVALKAAPPQMSSSPPALPWAHSAPGKWYQNLSDPYWRHWNVVGVCKAWVGASPAVWDHVGIIIFQEICFECSSPANEPPLMAWAASCSARSWQTRGFGENTTSHRWGKELAL